jgi:dTDP-4-dehydrorhamnose 3,5-epimerase
LVSLNHFKALRWERPAELLKTISNCGGGLRGGALVKFTRCHVPGAYVVDLEPIEDERGFFARIWCRQEFQALGLTADFEQASISMNRMKGTLRGMHQQVAPYEEVKLVRCTRGAIYDVIVDLRVDSPSYCQWFAVELTADNRKMVYVPAGVAHGFQTLTDQSEVLYQISEGYRPELARGVRWNDPAFRIEWPIPNPIVSARDRNFSDFSPSLERVAVGKKES